MKCKSILLLLLIFSSTSSYAGNSSQQAHDASEASSETLHNKEKGSFSTLKEKVRLHPVLTAFALSLAGVGCYKKSNRINGAAVRSLVQNTKTAVEHKVLWPLYVKYAEIKEHGITLKDAGRVGITALVAWGLKKAQSSYNLFSLGTEYLKQGAEAINKFRQEHPKTVALTLVGLGSAALALRLYKSVAIPYRTQLLSPLDQFLLAVGAHVRKIFLQSTQLRSLIMSEKGDLSSFVESEEFVEFLSSLTDEQQVYIYSLINECQESA